MTCPLCKTDTDEDLEHFLLHCPNFSSIRIEVFKVFDSFVENQKYDLKFMELPSSAKLQFLIGDIGYVFSNGDMYYILFYLEATPLQRGRQPPG
jgi:phosphoribosyl 1,2-cyclic phosphodiesterase